MAPATRRSTAADPLALFRLDGRVALVTGGARGLGNTIARALVGAGAHVVVTSRQAATAAAAAAALSDEGPGSAGGVACEVSDQASVEAAVAAVLDRHGRVDILVNNAGINVRGAIGEIDREGFDESLAVNVTGTWMMCRAAGPAMLDAGYGRVINVASTFGLVGAPNRTAYASSKGAIVNLTRALALEWATAGVTVNALAPGPFLTDMNLPFRDSPHAVRVIETEVAMQRWGELHEIQGAALFLASDASSYVTGSVLVVDGGWTAH